MDDTARGALAHQLADTIPSPAPTPAPGPAGPTTAQVLAARGCPDCGSTRGRPCRAWSTGAALPYPHPART